MNTAFNLFGRPRSGARIEIFDTPQGGLEISLTVSGQQGLAASLARNLVLLCEKGATEPLPRGAADNASPSEPESAIKE